MKNIIKQFTILTATLILAATTIFAVPANALPKTNFQKNKTQYTNSFNRNRVPQSVLDPNFKRWQPPRPVPVIPANINDIMMTDGIRIYYNPRIVSQVPQKISSFFLAHEYGHIYGRTSNEYLSDQFAAKVYAQTDISVVKAAIWHFANIQGNQCDYAHGCGSQRANNIGQTAGFSDKEIREIIRGNF